jgi:lipopolysaccharide biosynthesis protein
VIYENIDIPEGTINFLKTLKEKGLNVLVAINSKKEIQNFKIIENYADIIILRNNSGKDFGAYKDSINFLMERGLLKITKRLILANDSVYYLKKTSSILI